MGVSMLLDLWSLYIFFRAKTTVHPMNLDNTSYLVTVGLYRISRNPMYLGLLVFLIGWAVYLGSASPFLLPPIFVWTLNKQQIEPEEIFLTKKFGQEYLDYQRRVRRWL